MGNITSTVISYILQGFISQYKTAPQMRETQYSPFLPVTYFIKNTQLHLFSRES